MKCHKHIENKIINFMNDADLREAYAFGGAILDPLIDKDASVNDYDLCVKKEEDFYSALKSLQKKGYTVSDVMRTHNIYVVIKNEQGEQFDFSCMDPESNGILSVEKIYAKFPENIIVNKHNSIEDCKNKYLRLECDVKKEGAYSLLRRFLAVAQKYNADISIGSINQTTIDSIKNEFHTQGPFIKQAKISCLDRIVKIISKEPHKKNFVENLADQEILKDYFPEIHLLFNNKMFQKKLDQLGKCAPVKLVSTMLNFYKEDTSEYKKLLLSLSLLVDREKARSDKKMRLFLIVKKNTFFYKQYLEESQKTHLNCDKLASFIIVNAHRQR